MPSFLDREWKAAVVVAALGVLVIVPCYIFGSPANVDLSNHFRFALPFYDSIRSGDWYPGWMASISGGYGDASVRFYPPLLYYILAAGRAITGSWYGAAQLTYTLITIVGGLGMYLWAREFLTRGWAVAAAALYIFAPYHVNQLYQAYLLAEYAGGAILPFAFWFTARICKRGDWRNVAGLGVSFAVLVLTHLPLTVIGGIALAVYGLVTMDRKRVLQTLVRLGIGAGFGLSASAVFWLPMVREMRWAGLNTISPDNSVQYYNNFLFSSFSPENLNVWWLNILAILTFLFFAPALAAIWRARRRASGERSVNAPLLLFLFAVAMATYLSWPVWRISTTLQGVQFPWRWMAVVSIAGALGAAAYVPYWLGRARGKQRPVTLLVFGAMLIALAFTLGQIMRGAAFLKPVEFNTKLAGLGESPGLPYWWPIWTKPNVFDIHDQLRAPGRLVGVAKWEAEHRQFLIAGGIQTDLRVATLFYPLWQASMDGKPLPVEPGPDGAIVVKLPPNAGTVNLDFVEPRHTKLANVLSVLGWIGLVGLWVFGYLQPRRKAELAAD
jgi:hypothetical protein